MKITPIEIRQHTFEKGMRGYKSEEVDAFMVSLSQEWERVTSEHKMLKMQFELTEKELGKLKEVEMTLFRTLKTAEDTSAQITEQATRAGEQYIAESRRKADEMLADARKKSAMMVQDAESQARFLRDNIFNDLKAIEQDFRAMERYKENLMLQIRTLASNAVDSVERFEKKFQTHGIPDKLAEVNKHAADMNATPAIVETPEAPIEATPAADLPDLTNADDIPGSQPVADVSDAVMNGVENAVGHSQIIHETTDSQAADQPGDESSEPRSQPVVVESTPEPVKSGGSFFDQI
jgi:cell division initiation protein